MKSAGRKAKSLLVPHKCLSDNNNLLDKGDTAASHSRKRKLPPGATTISGRTDDAVRTCCGSCAIQLLLVVHKDALSLRSRVNQPWLSSYIQVCFLGQPVLRSHDLCSQLGATHSKSEQLAALVDTALSESSHLVVLSLQQDAIRWFPLLHIGGIYVLTQHCCDSLVAFQRTAAQRQLHRVLEEAQTKHILTLSRDMDLRPVCVKGQLAQTRLAAVRHCLMEEGHLSDLLSVDEVLSLGWVWISNHMFSKVWDEINYPFPSCGKPNTVHNFNGAAVEVVYSSWLPTWGKLSTTKKSSSMLCM